MSEQMSVRVTSGGSYPHKLTTRVGTLTLRIPRLRNGKFSTEMFARYQRSEQALVLAMMEMVINGVSTRKISLVTEELCGAQFSKSTVSELCKNLDPVVESWNHRPLKERYPFVVVDAMVREEGRVRARGLLIAFGVNMQGYRELLGFWVGDSESEASWSEFFYRPQAQRLKRGRINYFNQHTGLVKAIKTHYQGVTWQRCQTHFMRNILDKIPKTLKEELYPKIRAIFDAPDLQTARLLFSKTVEAYQDKAPKAIETLENGFDDATAVLMLPAKYRKQLRTINAMERLNQEVRRRERVIRIFPNRESLARLIGALLIEFDEKWSSGRRYFDMAEFESWLQDRPATSNKVTRIM